MKNIPPIHKRRSIRLKGYDFVKEGLSSITIRPKNSALLFGNIENDKMILNVSGKIVEQCWIEIPSHFPNVVLHSFVIMPNHIHGILEIVGMDDDVVVEVIDSDVKVNVGAKNFSHLQKTYQQKPLMPRSPSRTIGSVVRGFKIGVTKWMRENTCVKNIWQRNYYEHIIRNEKSYNAISEYIMNNPRNWKNHLSQ